MMHIFKAEIVYKESTITMYLTNPLHFVSLHSNVSIFKMFLNVTSALAPEKTKQRQI